MRLRRMIPVALLVAISASLLAAVPTHANSGIDASSTSATTQPAASTSVVTTSDTTTKPTDSSSTSTTKPTTSTTTTAPSTSSSTTTTSSPCTGSTSDSSSGPVCQEGDTPTTPTPDTPEVPKTPEVPAVPDAPANEGGGDLPFTGPGDVLLAIVLALLAGTGGILLLAGASGREQIEALSRRSMGSPSGFKLQYREVLKDLTD